MFNVLNFNFPEVTYILPDKVALCPQKRPDEAALELPGSFWDLKLVFSIASIERPW
jgi:hypothetical protein